MRTFFFSSITLNLLGERVHVLISIIPWDNIFGNHGLSLGLWNFDFHKPCARGTELSSKTHDRYMRSPRPDMIVGI